jgi:hypothetical protein
LIFNFFFSWIYHKFNHSSLVHIWKAKL